MKQRENEYTEEKKLRVLCGSWNVNAKKPSENIAEWLATKSDEQPDIVAVG
jgi:hypothetical protein